MDGQQYTDDHITYGYFDPYVLNVYPRLISLDGSTTITINGIGFVNSGEAQVTFHNDTTPLTCNGGKCIKPAKFIDKKNLSANTFPQSSIKYSTQNHGIGSDPFYVDVSIYNDDFTNNRIAVWFYESVNYTMYSYAETPANLPNDLLIGINFGNNNVERMLKYGDPKCRFTATDGTKVYTDGEFVAYPLSDAPPNDSDKRTPNSIHCSTPVW